MQERIYQEKFTCDTCGKVEIVNEGNKATHTWGKTSVLRLVGFSYDDKDSVVVLDGGDFCSKKCFEQKVDSVNLGAILKEKGWPQAWLEVKQKEGI